MVGAWPVDSADGLRPPSLPTGPSTAKGSSICFMVGIIVPVSPRTNGCPEKPGAAHHRQASKGFRRSPPLADGTGHTFLGHAIVSGTLRDVSCVLRGVSARSGGAPVGLGRTALGWRRTADKSPGGGRFDGAAALRDGPPALARGGAELGWCTKGQTELPRGTVSNIAAGAKAPLSILTKIPPGAPASPQGDFGERTVFDRRSVFQAAQRAILGAQQLARDG